MIFLAKKLLKGIGLFFLLILIAAASWLASYYVTQKANEKRTAERAYTSVKVFAENEEKAEKKYPIAFEYYLVRLEGETLNVYTCADNSEEFLYSEDIITANLTKTDIEMLSRGNVLYTTAQLTEFMENFVS